MCQELYQYFLTEYSWSVDLICCAQSPGKQLVLGAHQLIQASKPFLLYLLHPHVTRHLKNFPYLSNS